MKAIFSLLPSSGCVLSWYATCLTCVLSVSCTTLTTQEWVSEGVSDAWLDTPARVPSGPTRPQSELTHWKTGLPPARQAAVAAVQASSPVSPRRRDDLVVSPPSSSSYQTAGHWVGNTRYLGGSSNPPHYKGIAQRQPFVRTVKKVGPSIVPQLDIPQSTRTLSGGPRVLPRTGVPVVPVLRPPTRESERVRDTRSRSGTGHRHR